MTVADTTVTNLDREIEKVKKVHAAKLAKLRRVAAVEQQRLDARVLAILREQHPSSYERLRIEAADALVAEKVERARRARQAREAGKVAASSAYGLADAAGDAEGAES